MKEKLKESIGHKLSLLHPKELQHTAESQWTVINDIYNSHKKSIDELTKEIESRKARQVVLDSFISNIENAHKIKEFDEGLFCALVECVIVYKDRAEIRWKGM